MEWKRMKDETPIFTGKRIQCEHCGNYRRFHHKETDRLICNWCKHWIYKDEETKLKYKNKEQINKLKKLLLF